MYTHYSYQNIHLQSYVHEGEESKPIYILLHGIFSTGEACFGSLIPKLKERKLTIFAPDLPAHGKSRVDGEFDITVMNDCIVDFICQLPEDRKDDPIIIVGHSLGAFIAQTLAYTMQTRGYSVKAAVIICGYYHILDAASQKLFQISMSAGSKIPVEWINQFIRSELFSMLVKMYSSSQGGDPREYHRRAMERFDAIMFNDLKNLFVRQLDISINPELIDYQIYNLRGSNDMISQWRHFNAVRDHYQEKCFSTVIPGAGHQLIDEKTDEVDHILQIIESTCYN